MALAIEQIGAVLVKPPAEEVVDLQLAVTEFGPDPFQKGMYFVLGKTPKSAQRSCRFRCPFGGHGNLTKSYTLGGSGRRYFGPLAGYKR